MRYLRYAFLASLAFVLVLLAVANREMTTLSLLPAELNDIAPFVFSINLPVFSVFFLGIFFGVGVGFAWEWLREYKLRAEASRNGRTLRKVERELAKLKGEKYKDQDDVLALIEYPA